MSVSAIKYTPLFLFLSCRGPRMNLNLEMLPKWKSNDDVADQSKVGIFLYDFIRRKFSKVFIADST